MDITAASTERTIHIRICHHLWIRAFNMYIFKIPGFYECPISWVHFRKQALFRVKLKQISILKENCNNSRMQQSVNAAAQQQQSGSSEAQRRSSSSAAYTDMYM